MSSNLRFKLQANVLPVEVEGPDGTVVEYELREMTAVTRDRYLDKLQKRMQLDANGRAAGIRKFEGMQADLVASCLFHKTDGRSVSEDVIQGWPASAVVSLFSAAQELNRLKQVVGEDAEPKNV